MQDATGIVVQAPLTSAEVAALLAPTAGRPAEAPTVVSTAVQAAQTPTNYTARTSVAVGARGTCLS